MLEGGIERRDGVYCFANKRFRLPIPAVHEPYIHTSGANLRQIVMGIRPEHIALEPLEAIDGEDDERTVIGVVDMLELMGADTYVYLKIGDFAVIARTEAHTPFRVGDRVRVRLNMTKAHFFDQHTGKSLRAPGDAGR